MARDGDWWYLTWRGEKEELYNIARDPGQTNDLAASHADELEHMRRVLAGLATQAARGYRIEVRGPRTEAVTVEITSPLPPGYFDAPTLRSSDSMSVRRTSAVAKDESSDDGDPRESGWRVTVTFAPGSTPHVLLVEPRSAETELTLSAYVGDTAMLPAQVHLGETGLSPDLLPVTTGPGTTSLLKGDEPPTRGATETCEIWMWRPEYAVPPVLAPALDLDELPEELADQLRSLGYLR
jgi:hypothetical protein